MINLLDDISGYNEANVIIDILISIIIFVTYLQTYLFYLTGLLPYMRINTVIFGPAQ